MDTTGARGTFGLEGEETELECAAHEQPDAVDVELLHDPLMLGVSTLPVWSA